MDLRIIQWPVAEPVTLEEARLHLRVDAEGSPAEHPDDLLILGLIQSAREWAEGFTGRTIAAVGYELRVDALTSSIPLPRPPALTVDAVTYVDAESVTQTVDAAVYELDEHPDTPAVRLQAGQSWPSGTSPRVLYTAGYMTPGGSPEVAPLPASIRSAILLMVGHWYEHREESAGGPLSTVPAGAETLLRRPFRLLRGMA